MAFVPAVGAAVLGTTGTAAATSAGAWAVGTAVLGGATYGLSSMLTGGLTGGGDVPSYQAPSVAPVQTAEQVIQQSEAEADVERKKILARRSKTILTGPAGVFEEADTAKKTLLGS